MPTLKHYYGLNHLHYVTTSTYRRARLFDSERFRNRWVATLAELRAEIKFRIVGYVLMPEHFHALIWPQEDANPSEIMQKPRDRMALFILKNLRQNLAYPWCQRMLAQVTLPPTVHHHAHSRVWQRRFYDMNIWTPKKRDEKLNYEAGAGEGAWRLAVVELAFLFPERRFRAGDGPNAVTTTTDYGVAYIAKTATYAPPANLKKTQKPQS